MSKHLLNFFLYVIIAGGSMATGQYAKCSNDPLGIEVINLEEDIAKKPPLEEPKPKKAIDGLWENKKVLPDFSLDFLALYYGLWENMNDGDCICDD